MKEGELSDKEEDPGQQELQWLNIRVAGEGGYE